MLCLVNMSAVTFYKIISDICHNAKISHYGRFGDCTFPIITPQTSTAYSFCSYSRILLLINSTSCSAMRAWVSSEGCQSAA